MSKLDGNRLIKVLTRNSSGYHVSWSSMVSTDLLQVSSTPCCNISVLIILDNDNLLYRFKSAKLHNIYLIWSFHSASVYQIVFASYNKFAQANVPLLPHVSMKPFQYIHSSFACSTNLPWTPLKRYVWLVIL